VHLKMIRIIIRNTKLCYHL